MYVSCGGRFRDKEDVIQHSTDSRQQITSNDRRLDGVRNDLSKLRRKCHGRSKTTQRAGRPHLVDRLVVVY